MKKFDRVSKKSALDNILYWKVHQPVKSWCVRNYILAFKLLLHYCFIVFYLNHFSVLNHDYTLPFEVIVILLRWYRIST